MIIWKYIIDFGVNFLEMFLEMSPYLLLGLLASALMKVYLPPNWFTRHLGKNNWVSTLKASLLGVPLPLCSCGVIPTGVSLYKNGASKSATVAFLISTPQTGLDSIMATYGLLGLPMAIFRPLVAFFNGILGGIVTQKLSPSTIQNKKASSIPVKEEKSQFKNLFKYAFGELLVDIASPLLFGIFLSSIITVLLPNDFFVDYQLAFPLNYLSILVISIPIYVCATGSIPIALALMLKGLSPGAAMLFLIAGPATNIATINVIRKALGMRVLWIYLLSIIIGALVFSFIIDNFFPYTLLMVNSLQNVHNHENIFTFWKIIEWLSFLALAFAIIKIYISSFFKKKNIVMNNNQKTYHIEGMSCSHCENAILRAIQRFKEINKSAINRQKMTMYLEGTEINDEKIIETITELGYKIHRS